MSRIASRLIVPIGPVISARWSNKDDNASPASPVQGCGGSQNAEHSSKIAASTSGPELVARSPIATSALSASMATCRARLSARAASSGLARQKSLASVACTRPTSSVMPVQFRGPRSAWRSRVSTALASRQDKGCFNKAISLTGSPGSSSQSATSKTRLPAGVWCSAVPADGVQIMPYFFNCALTRLASPVSGVTSAAVWPFFSKVCRKSRVASSASSVSSAASIWLRPSSALRMKASSPFVWVSICRRVFQAAVSSAGASDSLIICLRARLFSLSGMSGHSSTWAKSKFSSSSVRNKENCG
ncbi:MAG: Uncharacterised protein [Hyphomonas sp. TMED17]|nr:MAG: Uncharacterised protein [Hyphomonas sp. TMED17]